MSYIVSHEEVAPTRNQKELPDGHLSWRTNFIKPPKEVRLEQPAAFLAESTPQRVLRAHFHEVDQWQVVVRGGGTLGKHHLAMHSVHFARAHTPYGPIVNGADGIGFLTLRHHWDPGAQKLPESQEKLMQVADRRPWQVTEMPDFAGDAEVNINPFGQIRDDMGLAAYAISAKGGASLAAPDASNSGGQFLVVLEGSLNAQGKQYGPLSIAYVGADEAPWQLQAGPEGMKILALNFPRQRQPVAEEAKAGTGKPGERVWQCQLCAFVYDEAAGIPEEGIAPGTPWEEVPEDWFCPDCSAGKSEFDMQLL